MSLKRKRDSGEMNLNDDVHFLIFAKLSFKDQISCAHAYPCLRFVVHSIWRRKYTDDDISNMYHCYRYDFQSLNIVLGGIHDIIKTMEIDLLNCSHWDIVRQYYYPNITHLTWCSDYDTPDWDELRITQIFKNVRTMIISRHIPTDNHFAKFKNLEELNIRDCYRVRLHTFQNILKKTHLKRIQMRHFSEDNPRWSSPQAFKKFCALEEITLQGMSLMLLRNLPHCPNLKLVQLIQTARSNLLLDPLKCLAKRNNAIEVRATYYTCRRPPQLCIWTFMGLKDLNLDCEDIRDFMAKNMHIFDEDIYRILPSIDGNCHCFSIAVPYSNYDSKHLSDLKRLKRKEVYCCG